MNPKIPLGAAVFAIPAALAALFAGYDLVGVPIATRAGYGGDEHSLTALGMAIICAAGAGTLAGIVGWFVTRRTPNDPGPAIQPKDSPRPTPRIPTVARAGTRHGTVTNSALLSIAQKASWSASV